VIAVISALTVSIASASSSSQSNNLDRRSRDRLVTFTSTRFSCGVSVVVSDALATRSAPDSVTIAHGVIRRLLRALWDAEDRVLIRTLDPIAERRSRSPLKSPRWYELRSTVRLGLELLYRRNAFAKAIEGPVFGLGASALEVEFSPRCFHVLDGRGRDHVCRFVNTSHPS